MKCILQVLWRRTSNFKTVLLEKDEEISQKNVDLSKLKLQLRKIELEVEKLRKKTKISTTRGNLKPTKVNSEGGGFGGAF